MGLNRTASDAGDHPPVVRQRLKADGVRARNRRAESAYGVVPMRPLENPQQLPGVGASLTGEMVVAFTVGVFSTFHKFGSLGQQLRGIRLSDVEFLQFLVNFADALELCFGQRP